MILQDAWRRGIISAGALTASGEQAVRPVYSISFVCIHEEAFYQRRKTPRQIEARIERILLWFPRGSVELCRRCPRLVWTQSRTARAARESAGIQISADEGGDVAFNTPAASHGR
jgi:hypothetical protein